MCPLTYLFCPFLPVLFVLLENSGYLLMALLSFLGCTELDSCGYRRGSTKFTQSRGEARAWRRGCGRPGSRGEKSSLHLKNGFSQEINLRQQPLTSLRLWRHSLDHLGASGLILPPTIYSKAGSSQDGLSPYRWCYLL